MKSSIKKGLSFGLTSGVITTLGLIVGLNSSTHSASVVISGILVIAIADALSDAMGMHMSEESSFKSVRNIWEATGSTFFGKFVFAMSFVVPFLFLNVNIATITSIVWAVFLLTWLSYFVAVKEKISPVGAVAEHLSVAFVVVVASYYVGIFASLLK